jgi:hypothetical protein
LSAKYFCQASALLSLSNNFFIFSKAHLKKARPIVVEQKYKSNQSLKV